MSRREITLVSGALAAFVVITAMVCTGTGIVVLDVHVNNTLKGASGPFFTFGKNLTDVVSPINDGIVLMCVATMISIRRRRCQPVLTAAWAVLLCIVVVISLKYAVGRGSPAGFPVRRGEYPSGHTASALVMLGTIALVGWNGRARHVALAGVVALTCLIASCLVYCRFHWLSDVIGSLLLGPVLLWLVARANPVIDQIAKRLDRRVAKMQTFDERYRIPTTRPVKDEEVTPQASDR